METKVTIITHRLSTLLLTLIYTHRGNSDHLGLITVMGNVEGKSITLIEVFNCKEPFAWTERLYGQAKAAGESEGCRGPQTPTYMVQQHLSICSLHGGLSVQITTKV